MERKSNGINNNGKVSIERRYLCERKCHIQCSISRFPYTPKFNTILTNTDTIMAEIDNAVIKNPGVTMQKSTT